MRACCPTTLLLLPLIVGCGTLPEPDRLRRANTAPVEASARSETTRVTLVDRTGGSYEYYVRAPRGRANGTRPAVLVLAGFDTGRRSLGFIEEREDLVLVGMDYPGAKSLSLKSPGLGTLTGLRAVAFDTLRAASLALDYLVQRPDVDPSRIVVLGVSFGSALATVLASRDPRVRALVIVYGGGNIPGVVCHILARPPYGQSCWQMALLARAAFGPFEPIDHVAALAPRRLLMVASRRDEYYPRWSIRRLFHEAGEPKRLVWYDTDHMDLFKDTLLRQITRDVVEDLRRADVLP